MAKDPEHFAHQQWLGFVQPVGLVVSIPALLAAQAYVNRNILAEQKRFLDSLPRDAKDEVIPEIRDFPAFTREVLGWVATDLVGAAASDPIPESLEVALPEYHERLRPTYAVREFKPKDTDKPWLMLIEVLPKEVDFDRLYEQGEGYWHATPQHRFERLLRETEVPIGLLSNGTQLRLVYAPRGETSGHITFPVKAMTEVAGRPILAALHMLLCAERLFNLADKQRLPAILVDSRKYQNVVSTELGEQVLAALYELVRGFQSADEQTQGQLLADVLARDPDHVYAGLLTVLMRLVFVLFAEDRGLVSGDSVYANFYSVTGLFERLRADAGRYPDTMDLRYGAWAQLLTLFRLIHDGGSHGNLRLPARRGYLFDPDRYKFLEGRATTTDKPAIPRVSDGVIFRVLSNLLILDGERLSYRTLDVEQIGGVYEKMMGFNLRVTEGPSIAIKPAKSQGAPAAINLASLLAAKPAERGKWLKTESDQSFTGQAAEAIKAAHTIEELLAALEKKIAHAATPNIVPKGAMVLQPSEERRRSGSHYTPRSLTAPIVRTTLRPVLEQLGPRPTPVQILALKVCDPAVGSGAFLVEACRQLGDELVKAWHVHGEMPALPPDEDELLHARRLVAQRCLYGVDKNPMAVDLAKLSLWLATLAKDHPFTFLDHSLRHGDSLVGLTRNQIAGFHWQPGKQKEIERAIIETRIQRAASFRREILGSRDDAPYAHLQQQLDLADESLDFVRLVGDLIVSAYFACDRDRARQKRCDELFIQFSTWIAGGMRSVDRGPLADAVAELRSGEHPIEPFHWEIEFPEAFTSGRIAAAGFDAIVGNPPFMGGKRISTNLGSLYRDWLASLHDGATSNTDLVAHFFRRAFSLLRSAGTFGLIATNTIAQGDTRGGGLRWLCTHGGVIYHAQRRYKWPGAAAVTVSLVHVTKGTVADWAILDGKRVNQITAYLFHMGGHENPATLEANIGKAFIGCYLRGQGFVFDDRRADGDASLPLSERDRLIAKSKRNGDRIFPYIGGEEINDSPCHAYHRYVISFANMPIEEAERWPDLLDVLRLSVKPARDALGSSSVDRAHKKYWWRFANDRPELRAATRNMGHVLAISRVTQYPSFVRMPNNLVFSEQVVVFALDDYETFACLQSQVHELWARFFSSSLEDRLRYTPSECCETFPFPRDTAARDILAHAGETCYYFRAALMVKNNEGLTATYNRVHDPDESSADILTLRQLHAAMDDAVLRAYGWDDLADTASCMFLLDYEDEEDDEEKPATKKGKGKKKPWRYRWPDEFRDEVLARLLALNKERSEQEALLGQAVEAAEKTAAKKADTKAARAASKGRKNSKPRPLLD